MLFTQGCNFRCSYCHNPSLVYPEYFKDLISLGTIFDFFKKRVGQLDGVVITGGEPLIHKYMLQFICQIKSLGYAVKLDTNGYFPARIQTLLANDSLDYIAMDVKAPLEKYTLITRRTLDSERIKQSIRLIISNSINYEFRITLSSLISNLVDIENIARCIEGAALVYLQRSTFPENYTLSENELITFKEVLGKYVKQCLIR